jgi:hypothetical protein
MDNAETNRESQQEKIHLVSTENTPSQSAARTANSAGETISSRIGGSSGERDSDPQKNPIKHLSDKRTARDLASKKRKKMAHRRTLRASHAKG